MYYTFSLHEHLWCHSNTYTQRLP